MLLGTLCVFIHLIIYYYFCFADKETQSEKGQATQQNHTASKHQKWNTKPSALTMALCLEEY